MIDINSLCFILEDDFKMWQDKICGSLFLRVCFTTVSFISILVERNKQGLYNNPATRLEQMMFVQE